MHHLEKHLLSHLTFIYGETRAPELLVQIYRLIDAYKGRIPPRDPISSSQFSQEDVILITYGDMVQEDGEPPLQSLSDFLDQWVAGMINTVHVLPFFPYSSDDGFSVIDYKQVKQELGTWSHISKLNQSFKLMFDAVINHISASSRWFQEFLAGEEPYKEFFIIIHPDDDLSNVFRPRAFPLATQVQTKEGPTLVWTTFGPDQIDLNYKNPDVLLEIVDTLLEYVAQGAELIRMDAIAFIWKEPGTNCIHLPQTHQIIQLFRTVLDIAAPWVKIITETNVPHKDNITYFGDGENEAQMVYNFTLPPLVLYTFQTQNSQALSSWASNLTLPSGQVAFLNFLASHDGVGVTPLRGILGEDAITLLAKRTEELGGHVSYKTNPDGSQSVYELNISYIDALGEPGESIANAGFVANRFLATQAIMLSMKGVPGIYFHSLFGSRSWFEGVEMTGQARTINRQKLNRAELEAAIQDLSSLHHLIYKGYKQLLSARIRLQAFHPKSKQEILVLDPRIFAVKRIPHIGESEVLCLHNVTSEVLTLRIPLDNCTQARDLLSGEKFPVDDQHISLTFDPYKVYWLDITN
jgi:sucrose phosphorylase